ncbi:MAG: RIP metalloprotease RseP [Patescibacteria group bacterium]
MIFTIIIFVAVLAILVLVHEIGHFITARKFGCAVEEFGIGFPPQAKKWKSKKTGINYSLNWIPLGGFVKIKGEDGENRQENDSFGSKKVWQRAIILSSGVLMNIVLAIVLLSIGFGIGLPSALPDDLSDLGRAHVKDAKIQIYAISDGSPAATAGLQSGDALVSIDGNSLNKLEDVQSYIAGKDGQEINLALQRGQEDVNVKVVPVFREEIGKAGIGVALARTGIVSYPWYLAPIKGAEATFSLFWAIVVAFYTLIKNLVTGIPVGADVAGPVGIAVMTGQVARMGFVYLLQFTALLSVNLAIINFLPLPALDGGRILFLIVEKIRRRPIRQEVEAVVHNIGFMLLIGLMIFVTFRDVIKWGGGFFSKIFG